MSPAGRELQPWPGRSQNHAMRFRKLLTERKPHVFHISARAVDENHCGLGARSAPRKTEFGHVQLHTLEIHELARWWMRGFNPPNAERGHSRRAHQTQWQMQLW